MTRRIIGRPYRSAIFFTRVAAFALLLAASPWGQAQSATLNLNETDLNRAIVRIADHFGVNIVAPEALLTGRRAAPIAGASTPEDALSALLSGSGLEVRLASSGAYVIEAKTDAPASSGEASSSRSGSNRGPMAIETVVVTGERVNRSLTDTVSSVAVLTEESMENSVILELDELLQRVPNVSML
ncbi:MAG: secretin and TonB N-terminal domain-containing protein, partial [Pseudomonadota bacterium]